MRACPNCGYPAVADTCPYCKVFAVSPEFDDVDDDLYCPKCGSVRIDCDTLEGDDLIIDLFRCQKCRYSWQTKIGRI